MFRVFRLSGTETPPREVEPPVASAGATRGEGSHPCSEGSHPSMASAGATRERSKGGECGGHP